MGPRTTSEARSRFTERTGIDPFADDRIGTAYFYGALAEAGTVMRALEAWLTPVADAVRARSEPPDFPLWVRNVAWASGTDPTLPGSLPCLLGATTTSPPTVVDMLALHADIVAMVGGITEKAALLGRLVTGLQKDVPLGGSGTTARYLEPSKVGAPIQVGKAKFVRRVQGTWESSGRPPLQAQDFALLAIAIGLEAPRQDHDGDGWWAATIKKWRDYVKANPPRLGTGPLPGDDG